MLETPVGVRYPGPFEPYPEAEWWQDLAESLDALLAVRAWEQIDAGEFSGGSFVVPVPEAEFAHLELHLYNRVDTVGIVAVRINDDSTSGMHRHGRIIRRASDGTVTESVWQETQSWQVAEWGTVTGSNAIVNIFNTNLNSLVSFQARGGRQGADGGAHRITDSWGRLNNTRLVTSMRVISVSGEFVNLQWRLLGVRA